MRFKLVPLDDWRFSLSLDGCMELMQLGFDGCMELIQLVPDVQRLCLGTGADHGLAFRV